MELGFVNLNDDEKYVMSRSILALFALSFILQIVGLSTSVWLCKDDNLDCQSIHDLDGKVKGLLISSFTLKCLATFCLLYCGYKLYRDGALESHPRAWSTFAIVCMISETLSGTVFIYTSMTYDISWSTYLYSFLSFLFLVSACFLTAIKMVHFILGTLEPPEGTERRWNETEGDSYANLLDGRQRDDLERGRRDQVCKPFREQK